MSDLKPCPFCGKAGQMVQDGNAMGVWWASCGDGDNCGAEGPPAATEQAAAVKWNRRAE